MDAVSTGLLWNYELAGGMFVEQNSFYFPFASTAVLLPAAMFCLQKIEDYQEQIETANKILDGIIGICQDKNDVDTCEKCCDKNCCEEYALKDTLLVSQGEAKKLSSKCVSIWKTHTSQEEKGKK